MKKTKILITGVTGFVGSNLLNNLGDKNVKIYGLSRTKSKDKRISKIDIQNFNSLNNFIGLKKINVCIHLAGVSTVEEGQRNPYSTFRENFQGALNLLESARINKLDKIIITSTSQVYGKNKIPYYEGYPIKTSRPYETSKAAVDLIAQSYADTFNLPVLIPRFVNIYGPGDKNLTRLIPKTINSILQNKSPELWGGNVTRDFIYIDDVIQAYKLLIKTDINKIGDNRIFNFGTGNPISVKELIEIIIKIMNPAIKIKHIDSLRNDEIKNQFLSITKAKKILNWKPKTSLKTGLRKTIKWHKSQYKY